MCHDPNLDYWSSRVRIRVKVNVEVNVEVKVKVKVKVKVRPSVLEPHAPNLLSVCLMLTLSPLSFASRLTRASSSSTAASG